MRDEQCRQTSFSASSGKPRLVPAAFTAVTTETIEKLKKELEMPSTDAVAVAKHIVVSCAACDNMAAAGAGAVIGAVSMTTSQYIILKQSDAKTTVSVALLKSGILSASRGLTLEIICAQRAALVRKRA